MRDEILELERHGQVAEAESRAKAWLDAEPDSLDARHLLGLVRIRRGAYVLALETLQPAIQRAPEDAALQVSYGRAALLAGDRSRAIRAFEAARQVDPNRIDAYIGIAAAALANGDLDGAESGFRTALRADEDSIEAWLGLGQTLGAKGEHEASIRCFNMALEIKPDDPAAQLSLGQTLRAQGYLDFAVRAFERTLELNAQMGLARLLLAETLMQRDRSQEAAEQFQALREHPRYAAAALTGLGELALGQGRGAAAQTMFQQALAQDAHNERAVIGLARAMDRNGQGPAVPAMLADWLAHNPDAISARAALAERLLRAGDPHAAVALWEQALDRNPEQHSVRADLALAMERTGDFARADEEAERAALGGRWPPLQLMRARAALRDGAYETARDRLKSMDEARLNPLQRRHRQHLLGLASLGRQDWVSAERAFLAMHAEEPGIVPGLPDATPLAARVRELVKLPPLDPAPIDPAPVLLVGLPGSGVHRLAQLLTQQSGLRVRSAALHGAELLARADDPRLLQPMGRPELESMARRYARSLRRDGITAGGQVVEWLPYLDVRLLPALKRALPGIRLLLAWRAPEACLLDWLAFGYLDGWPVRDVPSARDWIRRAGDHLALAVELLSAQAIEMEPLLGTQPHVPSGLDQFLGRPSLTLPQAWLEETRYLGLPVTLSRTTREAWLRALDGLAA